MALYVCQKLHRRKSDQAQKIASLRDLFSADLFGYFACINCDWWKAQMAHF
jgi:hypothetical protein